MASNVTLSQHLSRAEASAQECADAWAAWQESARNAGFAAVMGSALIRHCRPNPSDDSTPLNLGKLLRENDGLNQAISDAKEVAPKLRSQIREHMRYVLSLVEEGVKSEMREVQPDLTELPGADPDDGNAVDEGQSRMLRCQRKLTKLTKRVKLARAKAVELETQLDELKSMSTLSPVNEHESNHREQMKFIEGQALQLAFGDEAKKAVAVQIAELKKLYIGRASEF